MGAIFTKASSTAIVAIATIATNYYYHTYKSNTKSYDDLDDSVLIEILHRLPLKSAFQCKLVSKRWHTLISSPYFVSRFGHNQPNKPLALILNHKDGFNSRFSQQNLHIVFKDPIFQSITPFELKFLPCINPKESDRVRIVASYNDLLLSQDTSKSLWWTLSEQQYYVCNPLTRHWIVLPPYPDNYKEKRFFVGLVYNHLDKEDSMMVVRIPQDQSSAKSFSVTIFSSKTNQWTESLVSHPYKVQLFRRAYLRSENAFGCNATLHWLTTGDDVVAYNPYKPETWLIKRPVGFESYSSCLGMCQWSLQLAQIDAFYLFNATIRIWELKNYNTGEWNLKHVLVLGRPLVSTSLREIEPHISSPKVLGLDPNQGNVVYLIAQGLVLSCNFETNELKVEDDTLLGRNNISDDVFQLVIPIWPTTPLPPLRIKHPLNVHKVLRTLRLELYEFFDFYIISQVVLDLAPIVVGFGWFWFSWRCMR